MGSLILGDVFLSEQVDHSVEIKHGDLARFEPPRSCGNLVEANPSHLLKTIVAVAMKVAGEKELQHEVREW